MRGSDSHQRLTIRSSRRPTRYAASPRLSLVVRRQSATDMILTKLRIAIAALMIFSVMPAFAAATLSPTKPPPSAGERREIASDWRDVFAHLRDQIPELSPSQVEWLKSEIDDQIAAAGNRYTSRALAAMDSLEYQIRASRLSVLKLISHLEVLATDPPPAHDGEVQYWLIVAHTMMDASMWQAIDNLVERGIVEYRIGHVDGTYYQNYVVQAQNILAKILLPFLQGRLPR